MHARAHFFVITPSAISLLMVIYLFIVFIQNAWNNAIVYLFVTPLEFLLHVNWKSKLTFDSLRLYYNDIVILKFMHFSNSVLTSQIHRSYLLIN